uniref:Uncharacterized protein n=1 Tax=Plectus sambesii TaxID=2011161 RepID=A0A914VFM3_9BILA
MSAGASAIGRSRSSATSLAQRKSHSRQESTTSYFDQTKANKRLSNMSATSERSTNSSGSATPIVLNQEPADDNNDLMSQTTVRGCRMVTVVRALLNGPFDPSKEVVVSFTAAEFVNTRFRDQKTRLACILSY